MRSNILTLAFAAAGAMATQTVTLTPEKATTILKDVIDTLQTTGDLRVKLQQATPKLDAENAAPVYNSLAEGFKHALSLLPPSEATVDVVISPAPTAAQVAAICALGPKFLAAGNHASDGLASVPDFQDQNNGPARNAALTLGAALESLGWSLNIFHWDFINAGVMDKCDKAAQTAFGDIPLKLMNAGDAIFY
ncbi:hypothetical protein PT974_04639 [Cladobotryum mycophilum]|uniref:Uncharacterized protein n=1 Tax=Cladobotryum mycophilum TaxID=491253 RepID=A0ABR0SWQ2_9HYPO